MMAIPERTLEQRKDALFKANAIRSARAQFKRDLKAQKQSAKDVLEDPPMWMESMRVIDLLLAMPRCGRVKANKLINSCKMSSTKTIGGMTDRQRKELLSLLA